MITKYMNNEQESQVLRGSINKIIFHNPDNGYTVMELVSSASPMPINVVGVGLPTIEDAEIILRGNYIDHQKFGRQFKASYSEIAPPSSKTSLIKFLASGIFTGIGEKKAHAIVERFGMDTLEIIQQKTYRLLEVDGIGKKKAAAIKDALEKHHDQLEIRRYLTDLNLTDNEIQKVLKHYGNKAIEIVKNNPYQLAFDLQGFGFVKADDLARRLNLAHDHPTRITAGIYYALVGALDDGHCFLTKTQLQQESQNLLQLETDVDFEEFLGKLEEEEKVYIDQDRIYLTKTYQAETYVASCISEKISHSSPAKVSTQQVEQILRASREENKIDLTNEQIKAIELATKSNFLIITGGPGCGKTTVLKSIVAAYKLANRNIKLAAPTGKAAQRLAEVCEVPASTIHRLLRFDPITRGFIHGPNYPLMYEKANSEEDLDLLIIDEASMIDLNLAKNLFSAIAYKTNLILVGDKDQLPSVGAGRVFGDLLANQDVPRIVLNKIFRQSDQSSIVSFAHQVNEGQVPELPVPDGQIKSDSYFIPRKEPEQIVNLVESLFIEQIPQKFGIKTSDISILTPINRGPLGTIELNKRIQAKVNPTKTNQAMIKLENAELKIGDRVCQRVNNYQIDDAGVFNGDQGVIVDIDPKDKTLTVELWDKRHVVYKSQDISQLSLSYVMSVHRSQGSEIPCVIMILHDSQFVLLDRQLLYTGMTRAKQLLIIVGTQRALALATKRARSKSRNTMLSERIQLNSDLKEVKN